MPKRQVGGFYSNLATQGHLSEALAQKRSSRTSPYLHNDARPVMVDTAVTTVTRGAG
jgi:hypothetical protein